MPKPIYSPPEDFSISPLLYLLPTKSKVAKLPALNASLYARYEKVTAQLADDSIDQTTKEYKGLVSEEAMLKQVHEWLDQSEEVDEQ